VGTPRTFARTARRLAAQIKDRKVVVKLFLAHPLHAALWATKLSAITGNKVDCDWPVLV